MITFCCDRCWIPCVASRLYASCILSQSHGSYLFVQVSRMFRIYEGGEIALMTHSRGNHYMSGTYTLRHFARCLVAVVLLRNHLDQLVQKPELVDLRPELAPQRFHTFFQRLRWEERPHKGRTKGKHIVDYMVQLITKAHTHTHAHALTSRASSDSFVLVDCIRLTSSSRAMDIFDGSFFSVRQN